MKSASILRALREMDVPPEKAKAAAPAISGRAVKRATAKRLLAKLQREAVRRQFRLHCKSNGLPMPATEFRFDESPAKRGFLFDYCWPDERVALEVNGGIWRKGGGAHTGVGHLRDMEKMNLAQLQGWIVLQCVPKELFTDATLTMLRAALKSRAEFPSEARTNNP